MDQVLWRVQISRRKSCQWLNLFNEPTVCWEHEPLFITSFGLSYFLKNKYSNNLKLWEGCQCMCVCVYAVVFGCKALVTRSEQQFCAFSLCQRQLNDIITRLAVFTTDPMNKPATCPQESQEKKPRQPKYETFNARLKNPSFKSVAQQTNHLCKNRLSFPWMWLWFIQLRYICMQ